MGPPGILAGRLLSALAVIVLGSEFILPTHAAPATGASAHWSLQPLKASPVPSPKSQRSTGNPIDAFILARLELAGLQPSKAADKTTLLRRVTFDLTGLPPTPEEQRAFLADKTPDAYKRVVDRLLASPRHGERWARHWMDVVHFAETHGNDQDRIRTNAWPYRDYLIRSFNEDKPYARFVREQLAGDVLFPHDPQATVALGFIAAGPWDESSLRDIREDTLDRQIGRYLDRDDMVATTMSTFVSSTVHCARCHDHKFDPVSQREYYNLQAVFAGVDRAERMFDPDPAVHARRQALLRERRLLEQKEPQFLASLLQASNQDEVREWERKLAGQIAEWRTAPPASVTASNGSSLTIQSDGSVLASGPRPETDTYILAIRSPVRDITALKLEVLSDATLPHKGPGRQDNGNLHLSEIKIFAREGSNSPLRKVEVLHASADFDQSGWTISHAIDGKPKTAWGIYPQVGKSHHAVLDAPRPVRANQLPYSIERILAIAPAARSSNEIIELGTYYLRQRINNDLAALPRPHFVYAGASDFAPDGGLVPAKAPRLVQVLKRGDINKPESVAAPGSLSAIKSLRADFALEHPEDEGARRAALAEWIVAKENPLTWRSIVNRVWHYHFGRGLVDTPNDLGVMGSAPSHPELLDWMAIHFRDHGGSLKQLHRLIVTSATYRQSSQDNPKFAAQDGDNRLLWRMNRTRLDAESLRDAMLQISGRIDFTMGGPSDKQFTLAPGIHVTPVVDYAKFDLDSNASRRRSIYRFLFRTLPDPFMDTLDCPEASQLTPVRTSSVTALQALSMLNNHFVVRQSEHFAERLAQEERTPRDRIGRAFELALGRKPSRAEQREFTAHTERHGLANTCRLLFNCNEFMFVQ
ncbi:MAG: DUF1553 domain-containing protein [Verrucomicrobia bacterium]|nr:DUF1553 domain-containing protein [Verrucomicrobiota bacterium]